jgi:hypothetical protein
MRRPIHVQMFRALWAERQAFFSWLVLQPAAAGEKGIARSTAVVSFFLSTWTALRRLKSVIILALRASFANDGTRRPTTVPRA